MNEKMKEIGSRIFELRDLSDLSAEEMAKYLKIDLKTYKKFEEGTADIPASILYEIAGKLGVDMGLLLTGEETRMHFFTITRKGKGVKVDRRKQYKYENLAEKFIHKKAEPFIVSVEPKEEEPSKNSHPGQEFNYILKGSLKYYIHDNEIILNQGDSIFFDSSQPHAMQALNNKSAKFLAIIM